jgi:branched-chain amino acid transport system substrate-binding protein
MKFMRKLALLMAAALCLSLLAGCGSTPAPSSGTSEPGDTQDTGPIKIGYLGPLTGGAAQYGIAVQNGMMLYVDEINANGGVMGRQVEVVAYDDKGDAVEALTAFNRLVSQDEVVAIVGAVTSGPTIAVAQESANMDNPIPMITASATADEVTAYGDNMFRSCFLDPFQGETMGRYAAEVLKAKTAAVIYNNSSDYSVGLMESFSQTCSDMGVEMVAVEAYAEGDVDFRAQLTNINAKNPDVVLIPDYYNAVDLVIQQLRGMGNQSTLLGCDGWDGLLNVTANADNLFDCYFSNHYSAEDPMAAAFVETFMARHNEEPMSFSATAYDAARVLFDAMERAGTTESAAVIAAMKETDLECVTGHITFNEKNNPIKTCSIITIKDGAYKLDRNY